MNSSVETDRPIDTDKEMNQAFVEQFEIGVAPTIQRIKNWDRDPSKLNDLRTVVKADLERMFDDLNRKFPDFSFDPEKFIEAIGRSSTKDSEDDMKALVFLLEIFLMKMMESAKP